MKAYLEFTSELRGYQDVLETVSAVEQISASSIHRLKLSVAALRDYTAVIRAMMQRLQQLGAVARDPALMRGGSGRRVACIIGGDQGMVGGMHHQLIEFFLEKQASYDDVVIIGSKVASFAGEEGVRPLRVFSGFRDVPREEDISAVTRYFFEGFGTNFAAVDVMYPSFVTLGVHQPAVASFLPFFVETDAASESADQNVSEGFVLTEPGMNQIYDRLVARYIEVAFHSFVFEAALSELSARTVESENAADKTRQLITQTRQTFFRTRERWLDQSQLERFSVQSSSV